MFQIRQDAYDFHLFHRDQRFARAGLVVVLTLLGLALVALLLPRPEVLVGWLGEFVGEFLA